MKNHEKGGISFQRGNGNTVEMDFRTSHENPSPSVIFSVTNLEPGVPEKVLVGLASVEELGLPPSKVQEKLHFLSGSKHSDQSPAGFCEQLVEETEQNWTICPMLGL